MTTVEFEPFTLVQYEYTLIHAPSYRIWGSFPGLDALSLTLDRLRESAQGSVLVVNGEIPRGLDGTPSVTIESRYVVSQHNGHILRGDGAKVSFLDVSSHHTWDYGAALKRPPHSAALFCLDSKSPVDALREVFAMDVHDGLTGLGPLRDSLRSVVNAYVGFDEDAFFTFETSDIELARGALKSTEFEGGLVLS